MNKAITYEFQRVGTEDNIVSARKRSMAAKESCIQDGDFLIFPVAPPTSYWQESQVVDNEIEFTLSDYSNMSLFNDGGMRYTYTYIDEKNTLVVLHFHRIYEDCCYAFKYFIRYLRKLNITTGLYKFILIMEHMDNVLASYKPADFRIRRLLGNLKFCPKKNIATYESSLFQIEKIKAEPIHHDPLYGAGPGIFYKNLVKEVICEFAFDCIGKSANNSSGKTRIEIKPEDILT